MNMGDSFEQRARVAVAVLAEHKLAPPDISACQQLQAIELAIVLRALHGPAFPGAPPDAGARRQLQALIHQRIVQVRQRDPATAGGLTP